MVERAAPRLKLTAIRVNALDWSRRVGVSYRKGAYLSPTARRLIDLLKESAQNLCHA